VSGSFADVDYVGADYDNCIASSTQQDRYTIVRCGTLTASPTPSSSPTSSISATSSVSISATSSASHSHSATPTPSRPSVGSRSRTPSRTPSQSNYIGTRSPSPTRGVLVCQGMGGISSAWCNSNCNNLPANCPPMFCVCGINELNISPSPSREYFFLLYFAYCQNNKVN
jgi:hypothetical protein